MATKQVPQPDANSADTPAEALPGLDGRGVINNAPDGSQVVPLDNAPDESSPLVGDEQLAQNSTPLVSPFDPIKHITSAVQYQKSDEYLNHQAMQDFQPKPERKPAAEDPNADHPLVKTANAIGLPPLAKQIISGETAPKTDGIIPPAKGEAYSNQIAGGLLSTVQNAWNGFVDLTSWLDNSFRDPETGGTDNLDFLKTKFATDAFPEPTSPDEALVRGVSQFVGPFALFSKALGVEQAATTMGKFAASSAAGAMTNAVAVDPHAQGFNDMMSRTPWLANYAIPYMLTKPDDTDADGRLKNVIAGFGLGVLGEGLFLSIKALKNVQWARTLSKDLTNTAPSEAVGPVSPPPPNADMTAVPASVEQGSKPLDIPLSPETQAAQATQDSSASQGAPPEMTPGTVSQEPTSVQNKDYTVLDVIQHQMENEPSKAGNVDLTRRQIPDRVKAIVKAAADMNPEYMQAERRGTISVDQTLENAQSNPMTVEEALSRNQGQAYSAEEFHGHGQLVNDSAKIISDIAQIVSSGKGTDADKALLIQAWNAHTALLAKLGGATAEWGRAGQALQAVTGLSDTDTFPGLLKQLVDSQGGDLAVEDLANAITKMNKLGGGPKQLADMAQRSIVKQLKESAWDSTISWMLSNPATIGRKFLGDSISFGMRTATKATSAVIGSGRKAIGAITGKPPLPGSYYSWGQVGADMYGAVSALNDAWHAAVIGVKTNAPMTDAMRSVGDFVTGYKFPEEKTIIDRFTNVLSGYQGGPRMLNGITEFFKTINERAYRYSSAVKQAEILGLHGDALSEFVQNVRDNPSPAMIKEANDYAREATFSKPLEGSYKNLGDLIGNHPVLQLVNPLFKTDLNILEYSIKNSPFSLLTKEARAAIKAGGASADEAASRIALSTGAMAWGFDKVVSGDITGMSPANESMRQVWAQQKRPPYSIRFSKDGPWYSYKGLGPVGWLLGSTADIAQTYHDLKELDPDNFEHVAISTAAAAAYRMTPDVVFNGIGSLVEAMRDPEKNKPEEILKHIASMPLAGLPYAVARMVDPTKRDSSGSPYKEDGTPSIFHEAGDDIINQWKSMTPWLSKTLEPQKNMFGETMVAGPGFGFDAISPIYMSKSLDTPLGKELMRLGIAGAVMKPSTNNDVSHLMLSRPKRQINGAPVEQGLTGMPAPARALSPKEYSDFVDLSAGKVEIMPRPYPETLQEHLESMVSSGFKELPPDQRENDNRRRIAINKAVYMYRKSAQENFDAYERMQSGAMINQDLGDISRKQKESLSGESPRKSSDLSLE